MAIAASGPSGTMKQQPPRNRQQSHHIQHADKCSLKCSENHFLFRCPTFTGFNVQQRLDHVKKSSLCYNCLRPGHSVSRCPSKHTCRTCGKKHNSLIHITPGNSEKEKDKENKDPAAPGPQSQAFSYHGKESQDIATSLLATAIVRVGGNTGDQLCRVLVDGGSSTSFITSACAKRLGLQVKPADTEITGLSASSVGSATGVCAFVMKPHFKSNLSYQVDALIMSQITSKLPTQSFSAASFTHLHDLQLADPQFHTSSPVDILLGSDIFWTLLENEKRCGFRNQPIAVKTTLGWLVAGPYNLQNRPRVNSFITNVQLDETLKMFWETENSPEPVESFSPQEKACEEFYITNTVRELTSGRFITPIPWKSPRPEIGESRAMAMRRLLQMEKRLSTTTTNEKKNKDNQHYKCEYIKFMNEYKFLGHMSLVPSEEISNPRNMVYYIPHHFVLKNDSTTTKFRVVFDGSAKSSTGVSINDAMMIGATVQPSLFVIVLRFRMNPVAFCGDIEKMYRQILIPDDDRDMHRILWRDNQNDPITEYKLNTVTYGTAAAPFLATRTPNHLADLEQEKYPLAAPLVKKSCYMDDLQGGSENTTAAITTTKEIINLCNSAGFNIRKWSSNDPVLLDSIPIELRETNEPVPLQHDIGVKTLGIHWHPKEDNYKFKINIPNDATATYTKRIILSEMSQLFDPLGWLAPVTIKAKILMQQIWKLQIDWDVALPENIQQEWIRHKSSLKTLELIKIPRYVFPESYVAKYLVGYADASERAYAAVIYIASIRLDQSVHFSILTSKTRVAPLKSTTIPRLELNAAVLLAEVMTNVQQALDINFDKILAFSDSTITLAWINSDPLRWKTYVKNRVTRIQELLPTTAWAHIRGENNPADCI
ncbi:unnamed protein product [Orchesella dallaii]|uniref:CCHC-type domain-containing protein n=1 Tax=Orchesella dallaii TaxID=48710 RepID=A0ABP1RI42_9HEXA